jgi:phosphopantothenoylcysteine synthetase/decarboxylase
MRILLTCGPSYEPIDDVRRITNFSTGALGVRLAEAFAQAGHDVTCFKGVGATTSHGAGAAKVIPFSTNDDLLARLTAFEGRHGVGAFLHVAALADFKVRRDAGAERKISSRAGEITLTLVPAAKVIGQLRGLFPHARIVGWKYELDGTRDDALAKGARQVTENRTDACVVNGTAYGPGFGIVRPGKPLVALRNAEELSDWLVTRLGATAG